MRVLPEAVYQKAPASPAVLDGPLRLTRVEFEHDALGLRGRVPEGGEAAVVATRAAVVTAALVSLEGWASRVHLLGAVEDSSAAVSAVRLGDDLLAERRPGQQADQPSSASTTWTLYTSGTTGAPKPVDHTMGSLTRTVRLRRSDEPRRTWGLLYEPTRLAGVQVLLQAWASDCPLVDARVEGGVHRRVERLLEHGVEALSATPTMWRQILQVPVAEHLPLRQITLGGEIADQTVLDALARVFPAARITHVFASTETGAAFSVSDGRAGFPFSYLQDPPRGVVLDVRDGVLHVHSPAVSTAGPDGFASTEDLVEVVDDRVLFKGRQSGVVNVAGVKVWPEEVEAVLRSHDGVLDAVVVAKSNPLSGAVLMAKVVPTAGTDRAGLPAALRAFCRERLHAAQVPAVVTVTDALPVSAAGKARR